MGQSVSGLRLRVFSWPRLMQFGALGAAVLAGGCSAGVGRFDSPSFSLYGEPGSAQAANPVPSVAINSGASSRLGGETSVADAGGGYGSGGGTANQNGGAYQPPRASRPAGVQVSSLPEPSAPAPETLRTPAARPAENSGPVTSALRTRSEGPPTEAPVGKGDTVEVQQGDSIYTLAKRHRVSMNELMKVNGLSSPNLKPGQKLHLPAGRSVRRPALRPTETAEATAGASPTAGASASVSARKSAAAAATDGADWTGTYTVKAGDSLYAVARQHKVKLDELTQVNGISDARKVRPGAVLKVPASTAPAGAIASAPAASSTPSPSAAAIAAHSAGAGNASPRATLINGGEKKVAALGQESTATDAAPVTPAPVETVVAAAPTVAPAAVAAASGKLRWPVKGKVIASFGPRPDGTHNDGVNVAVPQGAEVHAADAGVVAYAGSELKGYGNLVLLRHDNGWVTAYAHNEEILVKRGDKVKRGQLLAKAGKTGQVDQPQVHFELRQNSKPVDPAPFMERM